MAHPADSSFYQNLPFSSDSRLRRRFMVMDEPIRGNMRIGLLLEVLEETALNYVNLSFPTARVVTAAIDKIFIRHVADVTRDLICRARINYVGRSSLEVGIWVEHPLPQGFPATYAEDARYLAALRSHQSVVGHHTII